ncbi:MAG: ABC transporter substrate-binding protein, partial [Betaproteobacteria bacterium]
RGNIGSVKDLKGKSVNVDGPGTVQHFMLSYILEKNGLSIRDTIRQTMGAQAAAQAFVSGQGDAAVSYEPYLSTIRDKPDSGRIIVTTQDYPVVIDVLVFRNDFIVRQPKIVKATVDSFFEALDMIKREPKKAYEMMGSTVKQSGEAFGRSASFIQWQDRAMNKAYYAGEHKPFVDFAIRVLKSNRVIEKEPSSAEMINLKFQ